jgi:hypothetical protein
MDRTLGTWTTQEGQPDLARRVEGGQEGRNTQRPEDPRILPIPGKGEDLIL